MPKKTTSFSIKNWSLDDRPREKLFDKGKAALSDAELLAILIGSGNKQENAVALCKRILASVDNNLGNLAKLNISALTKFKGIGPAKAICIVAAMELGRRRRKESALYKNKITSSKAVFEFMQPVIGELLHEEIWVIFLNNANKIIHKHQLSKGGITGTLVDIRIILTLALQVQATAIIVAHNHPSGNLMPSEADKQITQKIKAGAISVDIKLLDHIIVTEKSYFSFADQNLL